MEYSIRSGVCNICGDPIDPYAADQSVHPECRVSSSDITPARFMPWRKASSVPVEEVHWLWYPRIALGKLTLLVGDPGLGKSFVCADLAARLSRGTAFPDTTTPPMLGSTLMAAYEDGPGDTLVPRLMKQGADLDKVFFLDQLRDEEGNSRPFQSSDVFDVEKSLGALPDAALLVIDPIMAFVSAGVDSNRDNEVRGALTALQGLAERASIAVVCVAHLSKADQRNVVMKVSGSVAFAAVARSILFLGKDVDSGRRAVDQIKCNLAPEADPLLFTLIDGAFCWGALDAGMTAEHMLGSVQKAATCRDDCVEWLFEFLGEGPRKSVELIQAAFNAGYSKPTLDRAKLKAGIESYHPTRPDGVKEKYWVWALKIK